MDDLRGRTAVVTGASRGIGLGIATALAEAGANVCISARRAAPLEAARERIATSTGGSVVAVVANAGDEAAATKCIEQAHVAFGPISLLVNNAATNPYMGDVVDIDPGRAAKTAQVNQTAPLVWSRLALQHGMRDGGGAILNVVSVGGAVVDPGIGYYNATKAALMALTRQMAYELGPKVRVNAVAPGLVKTEFSRAVWETREQLVAEGLPLRRLGEPTDIGEAALFLLGERAAWITGQTLFVDGGATVCPVGVA